MVLYRIEFKRSAEHDIRKISPPIVSNIFRKIEALAGNPFPQQSLKLSGVVEVTYRLRVGDYRVIYEVDSEAKIIIIHHVRHRKGIYRKL